MILRRVSLAIAALFAAPADARDANDEEFIANTVSSASFDQWNAAVAEFREGSNLLRIKCRISRLDLFLEQEREEESSNLSLRWSIYQTFREKYDNASVKWIGIDKVRYEATLLPWRLSNPPPIGIAPTYETPMFAVRRDVDTEWMPVTYITLPMLKAKTLMVGLVHDKGDRVVQKVLKLPLKGFAPAAKWCGRQLLRDRQNEPHVRELTR